jgi:histidinol-phosphate aminotransferase
MMDRPGVASATRPVTVPGRPIRLDRLEIPFSPSIQVFEALSGRERLDEFGETTEQQLRERLGRYAGVSPHQLVIANGMDELLDMILLWRGARGSVSLFPPSDSSHRRVVERHGTPIVEHRRGSSFGLDLVGTSLRGGSSPSMALVQSPNDPTGTLLGAPDAVRLARACDTVVIDERHGEYSSRSLLPVAQEFGNVIIARGFETWAGLSGLPFAYAVAPKRIAAEIQSYARPSGIAAGAAIAAMATLDDIAYMEATVRRVRYERTRLWRTLRKLNMVSVPYPTWSNFILVCLQRGDARFFARELERRGVIVHHPTDHELAETHLRIAATTPEQTEALKRALIDIAAQELD